jgi:hypothetical protein
MLELFGLLELSSSEYQGAHDETTIALFSGALSGVAIFVVLWFSGVIQ